MFDISAFLAVYFVGDSDILPEARLLNSYARREQFTISAPSSQVDPATFNGPQAKVVRRHGFTPVSPSANAAPLWRDRENFDLNPAM